MLGPSSHANASTRSPWPASRSAWSRETAAVDRRVARLCLLPIAMLENHFRSALHQEHLAALGILVQRRHELVFRFKRDGVRPGKRGPFGVPFEADLGREGIERSFRWIAFDLPGAVALPQLGIVAQHRNAAHQLEDGVAARRLPVAQDLSARRVALARDGVGRFRRDRGDHHHLHQRQGAGLVGTDARYRAQRLDRREQADDRVPLGHPLDADRQRHRNQCGQPLRNHRHAMLTTAWKISMKGRCRTHLPKMNTTTLSTPMAAVIAYPSFLICRSSGVSSALTAAII